MSTYYRDDTLTLLVGDAVEQVAMLPAGSVDCVVTSPPYYGLRDYGGGPDQLGLEPTPADYVTRLVAVFDQVHRVLAEDGTCWLNLGDSYSQRTAVRPSSHQDGLCPGRADLVKDWRRDKARGLTRMPYQNVLDQDGWFPPEKNLLFIPERVAIALQHAGWLVRNKVVWHKPNAMPESVVDRLSTRHESLFLLAKSRRYWFDLDTIRQPLAHPEARDEGIVFGGGNGGAGKVGGSARRGGGHRSVYGAVPPRKDRAKNGGSGPGHDERHPAGRNPGDVWTLPTRPLREAHFATFPVDLPRRCIAAGCRPGGVVLDPFSGAGTTALAAQQLGCRAIGIDLNAAYHAIALRRMTNHILAEPRREGEPA